MNNLILKNRKYLLYLIISILIFFVIYYIYSNNIESFKLNNNKYMYLIWDNKIKDTQSHHGFGDKIRGAMALNQYCKKNDILLKIDASDDICSDMLENLIVTNDTNFEKNNNKIIISTDLNHDSKFYNKLDDEFTKTNIVNIYTNEFPISKLSNDDKMFAKNICKPKPDLQKKINIKLEKLPKNFGIQHFRFHDDVFKKDFNQNDSIFIKSYDILKNNYKDTDVLISNSTNFKKYCRINLGIKTIDDENENFAVQHIGYSTDKESVENSFIDFFIVCNAKYINTHTCYKWPSNFVLWPSKIYDIPLENTYLLEWDKLYN